MIIPLCRIGIQEGTGNLPRGCRDTIEGTERREMDKKRASASGPDRQSRRVTIESPTQRPTRKEIHMPPPEYCCAWLSFRVRIRRSVRGVFFSRLRWPPAWALPSPKVYDESREMPNGVQSRKWEVSSQKSDSRLRRLPTSHLTLQTSSTTALARRASR